MIIYKILNNVNSKIYVGQTKHALSQRIANHIRDNRFPVQKALNKYGLESFTISVIDHADTKEVLNEKEKYWIKILDCKVPRGYNVADGGDGVVGYTHTEEWKRDNSIRMSGENNPMKNPEARRKVREANIGRIQSETEKLNRSKALAGKSKSKDHARKISEALMGHGVREEVRKKISESAIGRTNTEESNEKRRITQTGKHHVSEEAKRRMSLARKGVPRTEEAKRNMRRPKSEEGRKAIAISNRNRGNKE